MRVPILIAALALISRPHINLCRWIILGHAQTKTTARYAHLASETLLAAVNAAADHMGTDWARKTGLI
jgi:hypothetical protein